MSADQSGHCYRTVTAYGTLYYGTMSGDKNTPDLLFQQVLFIMSKLVKNHLEALADHEIFYTLCMFN
jgi:hypothetical protein